MIARTIAQDTPWIILDEPVSNLDVKHQAELMLVLERLRKEKGKTIVAILHDLNLAATFCTQIVLMKQGRVFKAGAAEAVLTEENLSEVYELQFDFLENKKGHLPYIMPSSENLYNLILAPSVRISKTQKRNGGKQKILNVSVKS